MKVLAYTSFKEHCDLYTEIHGSIAIYSSQVGLALNDILPKILKNLTIWPEIVGFLKTVGKIR